MRKYFDRFVFVGLVFVGNSARAILVAPPIFGDDAIRTLAQRR